VFFTIIKEMAMSMTGAISWEEYFLRIARTSALRSKDPRTKVGCCIVNENKIIGVGYNGFPNGIPDDCPEVSWERPEKYHYVVHAEMNAILNTVSFDKLKGATLYCTLFPCSQCCKMMIQCGIKQVIYDNIPSTVTDDLEASRKMMRLVGITVRKSDDDSNV
jgi:dCMP deaminase